MTQQNHWYSFFPNLLTTLNLLSGVIGIYFALNGNIKTAVIFMFAGAFFDFFDGFAARWLKVSGEMGKQLDSLADVVTFGVLPGAIVFTVQQDLIHNFSFGALSVFELLCILSPLLIPALSAIRLAKFNIDERQSSSFIGLPTPANALFFASFAWFVSFSSDTVPAWIVSPTTLFMLTILLSGLLVSEITMFSLKFSSFNLKENIIRYFFLISSLTLILLLQIPGISLSIILYVIISVIQVFTKKEKKNAN